MHAGGDAPEGTHRDLAERLGKLLGQAKFGTDASQFSGEDINGPIHEAAPKADEAEPDEGSGET